MGNRTKVNSGKFFRLKNKKSKSKNKKKFKEFDKMTFEKREKMRERLKKERVYTKSFRTRQCFGAASEVRHIPIEEYIMENNNNNNIGGIDDRHE